MAKFGESVSIRMVSISICDFFEKISTKNRDNVKWLILLFFFMIKCQIDMEAPEFKDFAKEMVDYIANYLENIRER